MEPHPFTRLASLTARPQEKPEQYSCIVRIFPRTKAAIGAKEDTNGGASLRGEDRVERDGFAPVARAVDAQAHDAPRIDHPGFRKEPRAELVAHDLALGVEQHGQLLARRRQG